MPSTLKIGHFFKFGIKYIYTSWQHERRFQDFLFVVSCVLIYIYFRLAFVCFLSSCSNLTVFNRKALLADCRTEDVWCFVKSFSF